MSSAAANKREHGNFDPIYYSPLHIAACKNDVKAIEELIDQGQKVDTRGSIYNATALHIAAEKGQLEAVKILLDKGADLQAKTKYNLTPLHFATEYKREEVCRFLIEKGADVNAREDLEGLTPLLRVCSTAFSADILSLMIEKGANIHALNNDKRGCLHEIGREASDKLDQAKICKILIDNGCNVNAKDNRKWTPLHYAAFRGEIEVCEILIANKANLKAQTMNRSTPIHPAIVKDHWKVVELLLKHGADPNAKNCDFNQTYAALHLAASRNEFKIVEVLLRYNADPNVKGHNNFTPLHMAKNREIADLLLLNGANVNAKDCKGYTALHAAVTRGDVGMVDLLFTVYKADPSIKTDFGLTPLHIAASEGQLLMAIMFMSHKYRVDVNAMLFENRATPLHLAIHIPDFDMSRTLLHYGAYYNAPLRLQRSTLPVELARGVEQEFADDTEEETEEGGQGEKVLSSVVELLEMADLMFKAVKENDTELVKAWIEEGVVVNTRDCESEKSALHFAVENGNLELVKYLLSKKARVDFRSCTGYTPLHSAVVDKKREIALLLVKHTVAKLLNPEDLIRFLDSRTNSKQDTALHMAARLGLKDIVKLLVESGAMYSVKNGAGQTPADLATGDLKDYFKAIDDLFSHTSSGNNQQVIDILDKEPTVVNARECNAGATVLYSAIEKNHTNVARTLLKRESNVWLVTNKGNTVLHIASLKGNSDIIDDLVVRCPDAKKDGFINFQTYNGGNIPLHVAKNVDVARELLRKGAKHDIRNSKGKTPYDVAKDENLKKLLEIVPARVSESADK